MRVNKNNNYSHLKRHLFSIPLLLALLLSCCSVACSKKIITDSIREYNIASDDYLTMWAHSDIQPRSISERKYYETAISDINENFPGIYLALVAGDIIHWSRSADVFAWYNEMKKKTHIQYWYEIAGNHDQKDYENYKKYIKMPLHYSVRIGNMLILCLSDENKKAETEISDQAFNWWKNMVIANQDKIIITMTHAYVKESWLMGSIVPSRDIRNSNRFANILKKYKVDLWICGHTHLAHYLKGSLRIADNLNDTIFVNVSEIRANAYKNVESFILYFKKNSDELLIRSRNHDKAAFNDYYKQSFRLSHKFLWDGNPPIMKKMKDME